MSRMVNSLDRYFIVAVILAIISCSAGEGARTDVGGAGNTDSNAPATITVCPGHSKTVFGELTLQLHPDCSVCVVLQIEQVQALAPGNIGQSYSLAAVAAADSCEFRAGIYLSQAQVPSPFEVKNVKLASLTSGRWVPELESAFEPLYSTVSGVVALPATVGIVPRVKLDVLWVNEMSTGLCRAEVELVDALAAFLKHLEESIPLLDVQMASVMDNNHPEEGFVTSSISSYGPACSVRYVHPCTTDEDCQKAFGATWGCGGIENCSAGCTKNGSVLSYCELECSSASSCCADLCALETCPEAPWCPSSMCTVFPETCQYTCNGTAPNGGNGTCVPLPPKADKCPGALEPIVQYVPAEEIDTTGSFVCNMVGRAVDSHLHPLDQPFRRVVEVLDSEGENGQAAPLFTRPDAYLLLVFFGHDEECSIAPDFSAPSWDCETDQDCPLTATCKQNQGLSEVQDSPLKTCHGVIKLDYAYECSLLEEFRGTEHHLCAYDQECEDCVADANCPPGWTCTEGKCRAPYYSPDKVSSFQSPPGKPVFSLWRVSEFLAAISELKGDPELLLAAAFVGDGVAWGDDSKAQVSSACLQDDTLFGCEKYKDASLTATPQCATDPSAPGCEALAQAKLDCIRDCFMSSIQQVEENWKAQLTSVCVGPYGPAALGRRYLRLADALGDRGSVVSWCAPEGLDGAFEEFAALVVRNVGASLAGLRSESGN